MKHLLLRATGLAGLVAFSAAAAPKTMDPGQLPPPAAKQGVTFAADIKPVLQKACVKCHGPEKQKANMRLDSLAAALKGTDTGPVIVPGDSARSKLVHCVARIGNEDEFMPPPGKGDPLTKEQVGLIRAWVDQGAK